MNNKNKKLAQKFLCWVNTLLNFCLQIVFYLCLIMMCIIFSVEIAIVLMRYVMGIGFLKLQDLVTYAFSTIVTLSVVLAYWNNRHVKVDVLHAKLQPTTLIWIERIGSVILILPVFGIIVFNAWPLIYDSFSILEGSRETGGLGGLYLVKATVIVMSVLIILLAIKTIFKSHQQLKNGN